MPECVEAEIWRVAVARLAGRRIVAVDVDRRVADDGVEVALTGRRISAARRRGKVVLVDTDGPTLGLHLGMTGRLVVDGEAPIEQLAYASGADRSDWDRLRLWSDNGPVPALRMNDPRRLGRVTLDPDLTRLGPDAFGLTVAQFRAALAGRRRAIKPTLLDQHVVAGLGNLCADELLFAGGISPHRPVDELDDAETRRLARVCRSVLRRLLDRGGSTEGVLGLRVRSALPPCPRDGGPLRRETIGGRTAVWCPTHQR